MLVDAHDAIDAITALLTDYHQQDDAFSDVGEVMLRGVAADRPLAIATLAGLVALLAPFIEAAATDYFGGDWAAMMTHLRQTVTG